MGLDINGTRFLLYARRQGVDFSRTAMIGRQRLNLKAAALRRNLKDFDVAITADEAERLLTSEKGYAEPFLRMLGASEIVSFDASDYEKASCIHDFNLPLDRRYFGRFSAVLDGGTLEHIFNFPQAISNCMEMVETGGHFLGITPANNFVGHGFYQFSPELFFRIFSAGNGFAVRQILAFESTRASSERWDSVRACTSWYEVADPATLNNRVTLINRRETYLLVIAQKTAAVPMFTAPIQQSDYVALWGRSEAPAAVPHGSLGSWRRLVPVPLRRGVRIARTWMQSYPAGPRLGFDARHFRKVRIR